MALLAVAKAGAPRGKSGTATIAMASGDELTGVLGREAFVERAVSLMPKLAAANRRVAMLAVEISGFPDIRETYGADGAITLLRSFSRRVGESLRDRDVFGRIAEGGFGILLPDCPREAAERIADRIRAVVLAVPFELDDAGMVEIAVSIGLSAAAEGDVSFEALFAAADSALGDARAEGRNTVRSFGAANGRVRLLN